MKIISGLYFLKTRLSFSKFLISKRKSVIYFKFKFIKREGLVGLFKDTPITLAPIKYNHKLNQDPLNL